MQQSIFLGIATIILIMFAFWIRREMRKENIRQEQKIIQNIREAYAEGERMAKILGLD